MLIAGPTASGKSAVALDIARQTGGGIINADSMQVYTDLRILTARPSLEDEAAAEHLMYGHVDGSVHYSAARWASDAADAIDQLRGEGRLPIIIGGTGLYFTALTEGLAPVPAIAPEVRAYWRERGRRELPRVLHEELSTRDPEMAARLRPTDPQRIVRALEVIDGTGRSLACFQVGDTRGTLDVASCIRIVLDVAPDVLRQRIDRRFEAMMEAGALDEAAGFLRRDVDPMLPVMKAHGLPWLRAHLSGEMTLQDAIARGQADTRRYAKRQRTWFRNRMPDWQWTAPDDAASLVMCQLQKSSQEKSPSPK